VGTNVEIWLPISAKTAEAAPVALPSAVEAEHRGVALLVYDEDLVRMSTADMLSDLGYAVIEANSAEEAVQVLKGNQPIDIVITDHLMPGMTRTDLARHVQLVRPELPILLVSGYAEVAGVDAERPRLTKPFRKDELASTLLTLLD
jgi:CheY-like chemotaxis protein